MQVLHADDQTLFRKGFALLLARHDPLAVVTGVCDAEAAWQALQRSEPFDLMLIDVAMPGLRGAAGLQRFVERKPATPVAVVSALADPEDILHCIGMGARAYIPKSASEDVLHHALALVRAGEVFMPSSAIGTLQGIGAQPITINLGQLAPSNPLRQLTSRQRDTLALLTVGKSNKEIARDLGLYESTVKAHIKVILKKLDAQNRTEAAHIASDLGWPRPGKPRA